MKKIKKQLKKLKNKNVVKIILLVILVIGFMWLLIDYRQAKKQVALLSNPEAQQKAQQETYQKEILEIVGRISKLIILPEGEPNLVTVQNAQALATEQPFFKDVENGDKILIYKDKAVIFSPTKNILINVGPVYMQDKQINSVSE